MDSPKWYKPEYGGVAQLGEHLPCKQGVDSSILFVSTSGKLPLPHRAAVGTKGKTVVAHGSWYKAEDGLADGSDRPQEYLATRKTPQIRKRICCCIRLVEKQPAVTRAHSSGG